MTLLLPATLAVTTLSPRLSTRKTRWRWIVSKRGLYPLRIPCTSSVVSRYSLVSGSVRRGQRKAHPPKGPREQLNTEWCVARKSSFRSNTRSVIEEPLHPDDTFVRFNKCVASTGRTVHVQCAAASRAAPSENATVLLLSTTLASMPFSQSSFIRPK